jgi:hypothetical protein
MKNAPLADAAKQITIQPINARNLPSLKRDGEEELLIAV